MGSMEWTASMSVGQHELDEDHKQLFYLINRLEDYSETGISPEEARAALFALLRYAAVHFRREEQVMAACGYSQLDNHRGRHVDFVNKIEDLAQKFDSDSDHPEKYINESLLAYLRDWLTHHILIEDMDYKETVQSKSAEAREAAASLRGVEIGWTG